MPRAWSRSLAPGGSIVTSSTSVASRRSPAFGAARAAASAASASTGAGKRRGQRELGADRREVRGAGHSHCGSAGSLRAPSARSGLPFDRPSNHAASSGAGPVTTTAAPIADVPAVVAVDEPQHRALRLAAHRLAGVHEQGLHHRPGHVGERRARIEVDGVDPHLAGPYPRHRRRPDHPALHVGDERRPRRLRQLAHDGGQPVGGGDDVVADLRRAGGPRPSRCPRPAPRRWRRRGSRCRCAPTSAG